MIVLQGFFMQVVYAVKKARQRLGDRVIVQLVEYVLDVIVVRRPRLPIAVARILGAVLRVEVSVADLVKPVYVHAAAHRALFEVAQPRKAQAGLNARADQPLARIALGIGVGHVVRGDVQRFLVVRKPRLGYFKSVKR